MERANQIQVWDPFVRIFHWTLLAAFILNYATEGKPVWVHVPSGFLIVALIVNRVIWGWVGTPYARFADFVRGPKEVLLHLKEVVRFRAKRYVGHDPAGGTMIVALLLSLSLTAGTGVQLYMAKRDNPAKANFTYPMGVSAFPRLAYGGEPGEERGYGTTKDPRGRGKTAKEEALKEIHEFFANLTLFLVSLHIMGVLAVSLQTRENLVKAMFTGRKRVPEPGDASSE